MSPFQIAFVSIVAISMTVMGINLRIWIHSKNEIANLLLAVAGFGAAFLAVMELLQFDASDIQSFNRIIRITHIPLFMLIVSITWFVKFYFQTGRRWLVLTITGLWLVCLVINFSGSWNLTFSQIDGLHAIETIYGESVMLPYGNINPWSHLANLASILLLVFVVDASRSLAKKGEKRKAVNVGVSIITFMLIAGVHTPL